MSVHVEWVEAGATGTNIALGGHQMPDGQKIDADKVGLVLSGDDLVVIEGTVKEIDALLAHLVIAFGRFKEGLPDGSDTVG